MASAWQRPASAPLPTVYRRCTGTRPMPDGRTPNFWIQDITPDQDEDIVDFMSHNFLEEENMCNLSGVRHDPVSLEGIRGVWRHMLQHRAGLVALTDWPDGPDAPRIAGCNVTCVTRRDEHMLEVEGVALNHVLRALHDIESRVDVFARYGVDACLNALGLSVAPRFRGQGLGLELLLARDALLRALGLRLTVTVFTGAASQKLSARAGFDLLARQRWDECLDDQGKPIFPDPPCEDFQLKAKYVE
ncbi:Putative acetyltransferase [Gryllus bimaculatus]|nr:Putative acetyltransferase [Gryllus bimaculatus]